MKILRRYFGFIIILLLGSVPLINLFHPGLPVTHDGQDHVARIANFYQNLSEGTFIPRWAGNLNWGYGHPILMFLYPLPSYIASLFHLLGFSFIDSLKLVFGISYILSGACMYIWARNSFGEKAGILAGVLYMYAPYRFVDLYVRGAIGEHVAFLFGPLALYFIWKLYNANAKHTSNHFIFLSLSVAGLLLSHNAIAIMFLPVLIMYAGILMYISKQRRTLFLYYVLSLILGFGLSAFFIIPAYFEGKYTLRDIVTGSGEYKSGFVNFRDFFAPTWSFGGSALLSKQLGLVHLCLILLGAAAIMKIKKLQARLLFYTFAIFLLGAVFLMLPQSNFIWEKVTILQKFQFPWRLLSVAVLAESILGTYAVFLFKNKRIAAVFLGIISILLMLISYPYYQANGYLQKQETFFTGVYNGTTDTGESSPIWSVRFMEHRASQAAEFIDGYGSIKQIKRNSTVRMYEIDVKSKTARIRENTLYFPNWEVLINRKTIPIEFQDRLNRGLLTYNLPQGKSNVEIIFSDTRLRTVSNVVSVLSVISLVGIFLYGKIKKNAA